MTKRLIIALTAGVLACAMLFAGCSNKSDDNTPSNGDNNTNDVADSADVPEELVLEPGVDEGEGGNYTGYGVSFTHPEGWTLDDSEGCPVLYPNGGEEEQTTILVVREMNTVGETDPAAYIKAFSELFEEVDGLALVSAEEYPGYDLPAVSFVMEIQGEDTIVKQQQIHFLDGDYITGAVCIAEESEFDAALAVMTELMGTLKAV